MTPEQKQALADRRKEELEQSKLYLAKLYSIDPSKITGYNSGICYGKVWTTSAEDAIKIKEAVKGRTVNGGWFDGMPLGGISVTAENGIVTYEVMV